VLKMSMGKLMTDKLVRGINPEGVFDWLEYVRVYWANVGVELGFTWKSVKVRGGFVRNMVPGVISRVGKYVLLGQAMRKNTVYSDLVMRFAGGKKNKKAKKGKKVVVTEEDKMAMYTKVAAKCKRSQCDHAMGLRVTKRDAMCYNNGSTIYRTKFCAENMAKCMMGLKVCYVVDLFEEN
jgi:hypothetical protein